MQTAAIDRAGLPKAPHAAGGAVGAVSAAHFGARGDDAALHIEQILVCHRHAVQGPELLALG
jgi:hypothetical protein